MAISSTAKPTVTNQVLKTPPSSIKPTILTGKPAIKPVVSQFAKPTTTKPIITTPTVTTQPSRATSFLGLVKQAGTNAIQSVANTVKPVVAQAHDNNMSNTSLHDLSIKALSGDVDAQNYLKSHNIQAQTANNGLWNGVTNDQLNGNMALRAAYFKDNPTSDYTKNWDMNDYNRYNDMILNNKPMNQAQSNLYSKIVNKWGLDDYTNPLVQANQHENQWYNDYANTVNNAGEDPLIQANQHENQWYNDYVNTMNNTGEDPLIQANKDTTNWYNTYSNNLSADKQSALQAYAKALQQALDGQDVALNNGLSAIDANNFQQQQQVHQDMENRGLASSGIAADAYMRALALSNQDYQKAYADAAQNKASINGEYTDKTNQVNSDYTNNLSQAQQQFNNIISGNNSQIAANKQAKAEAILNAEHQRNTTIDNNNVQIANNKQAKAEALLTAKHQRDTAIDNNNAQIAANKASAIDTQTKQDQFLTTSTGIVYQNGKPVTDAKGNPVTTLDWRKMTETQRHNLTTETVSAIDAQTKQDQALSQQSGYVYQNGKMLKGSDGKPIRTVDWQKLSETQRHNIATENNTATKNANDYTLGQNKIAADLQTSIAKNKLDYAKLDLDYKKLDSQNAYNQDKIKSIADSATDRKTKMQLTALGKQSDTLNSQITAYQKKGQKPPKSLVDKFNSVNNSISKLIGGMSFNNEGKGVDYSKYQGYPAFKSNFAKSGVNPKWLNGMAELVKRESGFNPNAQNPSSSAHGYGQFLTKTRNEYEKKLGLDYDNPVDQIIMMAEYIKDRYGTPEKALAFWDKNHWY